MAIDHEQQIINNMNKIIRLESAIDRIEKTQQEIKERLEELYTDLHNGYIKEKIDEAFKAKLGAIIGYISVSTLIGVISGFLLKLFT